MAPRLLPMLLLAALPLAAGAGGVEILQGAQALQLWQPADALAGPVDPGQAPGDTCVNLGFLVDRDGATSQFVLLRGWNSAGAGDERAARVLDGYASSAAAAVRSWRFRATAANDKRRPVYTSATFVFPARRASDAAPVRARCLIADLEDFVARAHHARFRRGDMAKGQVDRSRVENPPEIPSGFVRHPGWVGE